MSEFSLTAYLLETGEIKSTTFHSCEESHKELVMTNTRIFWGTDHGVIEGDRDPAIYYVSTLESEPLFLERPPIPYAIDKTIIAAGNDDFLTISGLHDPCEITIDDPDVTVETVTTTVTGGAFEFSAETPGVYTIEMFKFPFLPLTLKITAVQAEAMDSSDFAQDFSYEFGS